MKGRFIAILVLLFKIVIATPALLKNGEPSQYLGNNASIKGLPDLISLETARELLDQMDKHDKGCIIEFDEKGFEYDVHPATCEYGGEMYTCTLSQTILMRDADSVTSIAYDGKRIITRLYGSWSSPYDRRTFKNQNEVAIDHIVPLYEAWISGICRWGADKKREFGNDVRHLLAVSRTSRDIKVHYAPPWYVPFWYACEYAKVWIQIKKHYDLIMDYPGEYNSLVAALNTCES